MKLRKLVESLAGLLLAVLTVLVIFREWGVLESTRPAVPVLVLGLLAIFALQVRASRKAFIAVAAGLTAALTAVDPNWFNIALQGLASASFIAAFFTALSTLRNVAQSSPATQRAGAFLASQRPGRRYAALTVGGQAFALLLNYGALQLLGTLAMASARTEPNAEIRGHRIRRMLLAIQRAFVSTLPWSPLSFAVAISTALIPGTSWAQALVPGLVTSVIVAGIGWALDSTFKPRLTVRPPAVTPQGNWAAMLPLALLLGLLVGSVTGLYLATSVRIVGLVAVIVPVLAVAWLLVQTWNDRPFRRTGARITEYLFRELPNYRGELTLLMMAGYIGTVGAQLLAPLLEQAGLDLSGLPPWTILVSLVWIIPLAGQIGMNPILAVTLMAPLIPSAESLGVAPTALVVSITAGWALSGATSPFTASTLLISSFAGARPLRVGLGWNGAYALLCAVILSGWVLVYAYLI